MADHQERSDLRAMWEWATDGEKAKIEALEKHGSLRETAEALGIDQRGLTRAMARLKKRAAHKGHAPGHWNDGVAPGYRMGKVTVQRKNGEVERVWERQLPESQHLMLLAAVEAMAEDIQPIDVPAPPADYETDIIPWINIGDAHIGMLAHEAETGKNFDLKIAERELCAAISLLIDESGNHERCVINDLGDATHYENYAGTTEASGHALDFDGRFPKMIRAYIRIMRFIVEKALSRFQTVDVIVNQGNHSRTNDIWMAELLIAAYGHTGRVNVLNNDNVFIGYRMGNTLVMTHHSDKCRPDTLAGVMATDFRKDWGETEYHYIDIGHIHHKMTSKEHPGVMIESFNILANADKYAHDKGYRSRQSITVIDRSRSYGELGRRVLPVERVRDAIRAQTPNVEPFAAREAFTV